MRVIKPSKSGHECLKNVSAGHVFMSVTSNGFYMKLAETKPFNVVNLETGQADFFDSGMPVVVFRNASLTLEP